MIIYTLCSSHCYRSIKIMINVLITCWWDLISLICISIFYIDFFCLIIRIINGWFWQIIKIGKNGLFLVLAILLFIWAYTIWASILWMCCGWGNLEKFIVVCGWTSLPKTAEFRRKIAKISPQTMRKLGKMLIFQTLQILETDYSVFTETKQAFRHHTSQPAQGAGVHARKEKPWTNRKSSTHS